MRITDSQFRRGVFSSSLIEADDPGDAAALVWFRIEAWYASGTYPVVAIVECAIAFPNRPGGVPCGVSALLLEPPPYRPEELPPPVSIMCL